MTREEFATAIPSEGHYVEWKTGISRTEIQRTVVAFSNASGGVIMLGVTDKGTVTGKPRDEGLEKTIWEIIQEVESPGSVELHSLRVGDVDITVISVAERLDASPSAVGKWRRRLSSAACRDCMTSFARGGPAPMTMKRWRNSSLINRALLEKPDNASIRACAWSGERTSPEKRRLANQRSDSGKSCRETWSRREPNPTPFDGALAGSYDSGAPARCGRETARITRS